MGNLKNTYLPLLILALAASSCGMPTSGSDTGSLSISVPAAAPWIQPLIEKRNGNRTTDSRGYMFASSMTVELSKDSYPIGTAITVTPSATDSGNPINIATINDIPAGTDYTVKVFINGANDGPGYATATGSAEVSIERGKTTKVTIPLLPCQFSTHWIYRSNLETDLALNQEIWYRFNTVHQEKINIAQTNPDCPTFLFDADGRLIATIAPPSNAFAFSESSETGASYFLGTAALAAGKSGLSVERTRSPFGEGSEQEPVQLTVDAPERQFLLESREQYYSPSYYCFTTNPVDTKYYFVADAKSNISFGLSDSKNFSSMINQDPRYNMYASSECSWILHPSTTYYLKITNAGMSDWSNYDLPLATAGRIIGETEAIRLGRCTVARRLSVGVPAALRGNGHRYADDDFSFSTAADPLVSYTLEIQQGDPNAHYYIAYTNPDGRTSTQFTSSSYPVNLYNLAINADANILVCARSTDELPVTTGELGSVVLKATSGQSHRVGLGKTIIEQESGSAVQLTFPTISGKTYRIELLDAYNAAYYEGFSDMVMAAVDESNRIYFDFVDSAIADSTLWPRKAFRARGTSSSIILRPTQNNSRLRFGVIIEEYKAGDLDVTIR